MQCSSPLRLGHHDLNIQTQRILSADTRMKMDGNQWLRQCLLKKTAAETQSLPNVNASTYCLRL